MPCIKCKNGKYKYGNTGKCKYDTKEQCEKDNPKKYNKMNKPTPIGKTYKQYQKELRKVKLANLVNIKLSKVDDLEDALSRGLGLTEFVEEALDEAFSQFIKAKENKNLTLAEQKKKYADERRRFDQHQAFLNSGLYNKG